MSGKSFPFFAPCCTQVEAAHEQAVKPLTVLELFRPRGNLWQIVVGGLQAEFKEGVTA